MTNNNQMGSENQENPAEQTVFKSEEVVKKTTAIGLEENIAGLLCYIFAPIIAIVFLFMEKENRFVRFHAVQSIILTLTMIVLGIGLSIFGVILSVIKLGIIGGLITGMFWILIGPLVFFVAIFLMYQAYQGKMFKLPIIGNMAEKYSVIKEVVA